DAGAAAAEYGAQFRSVTEAFLQMQLIHSAVAKGVEVIAHDASYQHAAAFDPASGTGSDSAALSVARLRDGVSELCVTKEWKPPFDPLQAIREAAEIAKDYGLS